MKIGSQGEHVKVLQRALNDTGENLVVDGIFGPVTEAAVLRFQVSQGLVATGHADPGTLSVLRSWDMVPGSIENADLAEAAYRLRVDLAAIGAIVAVESRGRGFLPSGRPVILFERHILRRRLRAHGVLSDRVSDLMAAHPNLVNSRTGGYYGGEREWGRMEQAMSIHREAAIESASWGLFQVMGFHWQRLGYQSAEDWLERMQRSERDQLDAFVRFLEADPVLHQALREHRWQAVARRYNGPAYAQHRYDERLAAEFAAAQRDRA